MADGRVEFLGRRDHQVKVRGYRIELGEIESVLSEYAQVMESVVVAREDETGQKQLVGYVVLKPNAATDESELREHLLRRLPDYMIPAMFVFMDAMPLTPNGKVDRHALPAPIAVRRVDVEFVPPRNPVEEVLAAIWAEVLNQDLIGVYDNFFARGGHSLLATQVVAQMRDLLQVDTPVEDFFDAPTIAGLAETLLHKSDRRARVEQIAQVLVGVLRLSDEEMELRFNSIQ